MKRYFNLATTLVLCLIMGTACSNDKDKPKFNSIKLDRDSVFINVGGEDSLTYSVSPANIKPDVTWRSGSIGIATVNNTGKVKGLRAGFSVVTVTADYYGSIQQDECIVVVTNVEATDVKLSETEKTLLVGESFDLLYTVIPENTTEQNIRWEVGDSKIATVNKGKVTAVSPGETTVTATVAGSNVSATCKITVNPVEVTEIQLSKQTLEVNKDSVIKITAKLLPENATYKTLKWSSSNESVATVDNGVIKTIKVGTCTITASTTDGKIKSTCTVNVIPVKVTGIYLNVPTSLLLGDNSYFSYEVIPENAENKNATITSSDENVAIIEGNKLKTVGFGTTTITATTEEGNFKSIEYLNVVDITGFISTSSGFASGFINGIPYFRLQMYIKNSSTQSISVKNIIIFDKETNKVLSNSENVNASIMSKSEKTLYWNNPTQTSNIGILITYEWRGETYSTYTYR